MSKLLYVLLPCKPHHKQWIREAAGRCSVVFRDECDDAAKLEAVAAATAVFGEPAPEKLRQFPHLEWLQISWAGADRYTTAPWFPEHVLLSCATGAYGDVIAEYLMGVTLSMYWRLPRYFQQQRKAVWQPRFSERSIQGKTVLILGAGNIGTEFAKRLRPFGATILGVRRTARAKPPEFDEMYTLADLPKLWGRADIVSCSLPDTPETRNLVDEKALLAMKPDALFINVGRGSLVDADMLAGVLQSGRLLGAVLDVCEPEPLPAEHPLWRLENVLITPHIAGVSFGNIPETEDHIIQICCENLRRYAAGQRPANLVNFSKGYAD